MGPNSAVACGHQVLARQAAAARSCTEQLPGALNGRIVIEQTKGVVAQSRGVSVEVVFGLVRAFSRQPTVDFKQTNHKLS